MKVNNFFELSMNKSEIKLLLILLIWELWRRITHQNALMVSYSTYNCKRKTSNKCRVVAQCFYLESILLKGLPCTDTAKVPTRTPNCTEIHSKLIFSCL